MKRDKNHNLELDFSATRKGGLIDAGRSENWPKPDRFPLNLSDRKVEHETLQDLKESDNPLIICGYASLDRCIDFIANSTSSDIKILFGNEPFLSQRGQYSIRQRNTNEAETYWLDRGISLLLSGKIIEMIDRIKSGDVKVRYLDRKAGLHAKIYIGDEAASIGSSNFTTSGFRLQHEANARFSRKSERKRYAELVQIAQNYWNESSDYSEGVIALLEGLLRVVNWEEALARASGELLEGEWAQKYIHDDYLKGHSLWPSQKQGIAQALYVLSNQGSVLIADATGSGKTRMGVHLIGSIQDQLLRSGRLGRGKPILICPPLVEHNWENEVAVSSVSLSVHSHGKLSRVTSGKHDPLANALQRAQILCVDEGHNFLNNKSARSQQLLRNIADHVVLFTATPINKGASDLLHIADLLGADNLQEQTVDAFKKLLGFRSFTHDLSEEEIEDLRREIQRFTVRRTKRALNKLIEASPDEYISQDGTKCRFPKHRARYYSLDEPEADRKIAAEIKELANQLHGVTYFKKPLRMPAKLVQLGMTEEQYLQRRISSAKTLAVYSIMAALRSSRVALVEHIIGTRKAIEKFSIKNFTKTDSGNLRGAILQLKVPENNLSIDLPEWLSDEDKHRAVCQSDIKTYDKVLQLVMKLSDRREQAKIKLLRKLSEDHHLALAFDSRPITLAYLRMQMEQDEHEAAVLMATGDATTNRKKFIESFELGSSSSKAIGLCSDSLSEGVNLQQASVMVHLDIPSVVRIAEQRVGRIDRMDSPHKTIQAWWPKDAEEFALTSDHRFLERYEMVDSLLGSNMPLPENFDLKSRAVKPEELVKDYDAEAETWDGLEDAFQPVRLLVEGQTALVSPKIYNHYRNVKQSVLSRVSLVSAETPWAFFCLSAGPFGAPKWLIFQNLDDEATLELSDVVDSLRNLLTPETESATMDAKAISTLSEFISRLNDIERTFLPMKKQRALEEMENCMGQFINAASKNYSEEDLNALFSIQAMFNSNSMEDALDWDEIASRWLEIIRPIWFEKLQGPRTKPLLLKDIRQDVLASAESLIPQVLESYALVPTIQSPDERVKACIVGIPK
jgi:superfamily II DNA or RNA helicase